MIIPGYTYVTHKLINRPWGAECRFTVRNVDGILIDDVVPINNMNISTDDLIETVSSHLTILKNWQDREALICHYFDNVGIEIKEALIWAVIQIRKFPNATIIQAEAQWDLEFSESIFTFSKLIKMFQDRIGENITWIQFKTYVINHRFVEID